MTTQFSILGAGSWGTALGVALARAERTVQLWSRRPEHAADLQEKRQNVLYLEGAKFPDTLEPTADLPAALDAEVILVAPPSRAFRDLCEKIAEHGLDPRVCLISCTKGLELDTGKRMSEILEEFFPDNPVAVLSGPTHAEEVARGTPSAAVIGSTDLEVAGNLQSRFDLPNFRIYRNEDVTGIELGGALKNIYAIGAGICDGLQLGDNAKAALITRSLAEMIRLGVCLGGKPETFQGLGGIGDLMVTCFSRHSRNRRFGELLGQGQTVAEIREGTHSVAEGYPTAASVHQQARRLEARTPVLDAIYQILYDGLSAKGSITQLMERDQRHEIDQTARR